jgi:hypothetical protein
MQSCIFLFVSPPTTSACAFLKLEIGGRKFEASAAKKSGNSGKKLAIQDADEFVPA